MITAGSPSSGAVGRPARPRPASEESAMQTRPFPPLSSIGLPAWLGTLAAFAALCAILAWWAVQLLAPRAPIAPAVSAGETQALPTLRQATQLFGSAAGAHTQAMRGSVEVSVLGVLAAGMRGSAILSVDGQPPAAYAVGQRIAPGQTLVEVRGNLIVIEQDGRRVELAAPARPALSLLDDGPSPAGTPHPGFAGALDGPRVARPLGGSSDAGLAPRPRAAVPGALPGVAAHPNAPSRPTIPAGSGRIGAPSMPIGTSSAVMQNQSGGAGAPVARAKR